MSRRRPEVESDDHSRWLVSYADFITLLFGFFVVMYAASSVNDGKYRVVSESLEAAFHSPQKSREPIQVGRLARSPYRDDVRVRESPAAIVPTRIPLLVEPIRIAGAEIVPRQDKKKTTASELAALDSTRACPTIANPSNAGIAVASNEIWQFPEEPEELQAESDWAKVSVRESDIAMLEGRPKLLGTEDEDHGAVGGSSGSRVSDEASRIAETLSLALPGLLKNGEVSIRFTPEAAEIEIASGLLFDSASAGMDSEALPILSHVAAALRMLDNNIRVEGFTDDRPIRTAVYPSNWELSAARAASVVHQFTRMGVDPRRMAATGYGAHRPVAPNDTPAGRKRNRRVLILVLATSRQAPDEIASFVATPGENES